jgi:hypothetical protein
VEPVSDDDAAREELVRALLTEEKRRAKRQAYRADEERRWDKIARDPKAYFTKRRDWEEAIPKAKRFGWDLSIVPDLNRTG